MATAGKTWVREGRKAAGEAIDLQAERARLAKEQADKTALENAVRRGELVSVEETAQEWEAICGTIRQRFLGLPSKIAKRLEHKTAAEIYTALEDEIRLILTEISGGKRNRAARRAAKKGGSR